MLSVRDVVIALAGWCCLAAFAAQWIGGGGKSVLDYARRSLQPLPPSRTLAYDDDIHAIWSGWWTPSRGYRLTNDTDPDVVFLAAGARDCSVELVTFPLTGNGFAVQTIYAALNAGASVGPIEISVEQKVVIAHVGDLVDGVNYLTLRLPDAHKTDMADERVKSLGVRSIRFTCRVE